MSKWHNFHSKYSPVVINKPNLGNANLQQDWERESHQSRMTINGKPLSTYREEYGGFKTVENIKLFFDQVILKDLKNVSEEQKTEIIAYLATAFHQGGFMYPVASSFAVSMVEEVEEVKEVKEVEHNQKHRKMIPYATVSSENMSIRINIETTSTGFKVQEITSVKELRTYPDSSVEEMADEEYRIKPNPGKDYVVKLEGTIDIDFSQSSTPSITVESNKISYGHEGIKSRYDSRSFGQKIVDFFRNILGLNQVEDISAKFESIASTKKTVEKQTNAPSTEPDAPEEERHLSPSML